MEELKMTTEEVNIITKALQDQKFREMLHSYAQEISDPDNRKMYEEEIKLLEKERGNSVEFIHPKAFRVIKTSVDGQKKCFINICSSEKVGKPESKSSVSEEGRRGQCWSLPHSLHPGRQDTDGKGNKVVVYDVVFHPDTLHIAGKNKRFMDMVDNTAIEGIEKAFKVTIDHKNVKELRTKYKGTPQPCVIRKPIPGVKVRAPSEQLDPLAFPYPDEASSKQQAEAEELPSTQHRNNGELENVLMQPVKTEQPTKPNYTLRYRSFIDLQDFRCSRDSAQSPRPKEIVVTIDLPLLKSSMDTSLEVKGKTLLLESKKPAYRLELPLAYPVDEDKGEAKFNKQKRQLAITLPVLPLDLSAVSDVSLQSASEETWNGDGDDEEIETNGPGAEETNRKQLEENKDIVPESRVQFQEEKSTAQEKNREVREETQQNQDQPEDIICDGAAEESDCAVTGFQCDASVFSPGEETSAAVSNRPEVSPQTEKQLCLISAQHSCGAKEEMTPTAGFKFPDVQKKNENSQQTQQENLQVIQESLAASNHSREEGEEEDHCTPQAAAIDEVSQQPEGGSCKRRNTASEKQQQIKGRDEDRELPAAATVAWLREVDKDGNETVISNHSTSAGFTFHNSLTFELD
ncbi:unnamed protein product [Ophioblennius macclurei]